jgi:hypothetical protein
MKKEKNPFAGRKLICSILRGKGPFDVQWDQCSARSGWTYPTFPLEDRMHFLWTSYRVASVLGSTGLSSLIASSRSRKHEMLKFWFPGWMISSTCEEYCFLTTLVSFVFHSAYFLAWYFWFFHKKHSNFLAKFTKSLGILHFGKLLPVRGSILSNQNRVGALLIQEHS